MRKALPFHAFYGVMILAGLSGSFLHGYAHNYGWAWTFAVFTGFVGLCWLWSVRTWLKLEDKPAEPAKVPAPLTLAEVDPVTRELYRQLVRAKANKKAVRPIRQKIRERNRELLAAGKAVA